MNKRKSWRHGFRKHIPNQGGERLINREIHMGRIIKEFLIMFFVLFFVISGLLFGWSAVHGHYAEKATFQQVQPQKRQLIITFKLYRTEGMPQSACLLS